MEPANAATRHVMSTRRRTADPRGSAIVVIGPASAGALAAHRYGMAGRLLARALAASLDGRLAAGESPEATDDSLRRSVHGASAAYRHISAARTAEQTQGTRFRDATCRVPLQVR